MTAGSGQRFPLLEVTGTPYQRGRAHGAALRQAIGRALAFCRDGGLPASFPDAMRYAGRSLPYCREHAPELLEEVQGIADGSGCAFEEIFTLNASLDLQLSARRMDALPPDCWTLAVNADLMADDRTCVLWTAEDSARWFDCCVLLKMTLDSEWSILVWTFAGFVGRPGINRHLGFSASAQLVDDCGDGLPYPFLCRKILDCHSTGEAVAAITRYRRMSGMAYTIGDASGDLATVMTTAGSVRLLENRPGWTASTGWRPEERLARLEELLSAPERRLTPHNLRQIQADHGNGPLCGHADAGLITLCAFIADVRAQRLSVTYGSPCENAYVDYTL